MVAPPATPPAHPVLNGTAGCSPARSSPSHSRRGAFGVTLACHAPRSCRELVLPPGAGLSLAAGGTPKAMHLVLGRLYCMTRAMARHAGALGRCSSACSDGVTCSMSTRRFDGISSRCKPSNANVGGAGKHQRSAREYWEHRLLGHMAAPTQKNDGDDAD